MSPYRTAAPRPPEPKPKRQFKFMVPKIKFSKPVKVLGCLVPIGSSTIGMGLLYDAPILGLGFKWGAAVALALVAVFFAGVALVILDSKDY